MNPSPLSTLSSSVVEVNKDALRQNLDVLRRGVGSSCRVGAVVKADGYGLGAEPLARHLEALGVDQFFVFDSLQAIRLIDALGPSSRVLVLRPRTKDVSLEELAPLLRDERVHWNAHSLRELEWLDDLARVAGGSLQVHIEVDTGMNRGGCEPAELPRIRDFAEESPRLVLAGLCSHLATSDSDLDVVRVQAERFERLIRGLRKGIPTHLYNSHAAIRLGGHHHHDVVRVGLALLGYFTGPPDHPSRPERELKPVLRWMSQIAQVRSVRAGDWIGYGRSCRAEQDLRVGVVPVGYADGYPARVVGETGFEVGLGIREDRWFGSQVLGLVNMDQIIIDLSNHPDVSEGSPVEIYGNDPSRPNFPVEVAKRAGTIVYDLLCRIGSRVERHWV